ncbi:MAG: amidohydrolase family protein [Anaerolineaceae bacterium]|nr:amidohydrolase family protein [Anaerolineaceae bacterium]
MRGQAKCYDELLAYCQSLPIVDCHDHTGYVGPKLLDPLQAVIDHYYLSDIFSVAGVKAGEQIIDTSIDWKERWPIFEAVWQKTCHTSYAQVVKRVLKKFYDVDEVTFDAFASMEDRLLDLENVEVFDGILGEAKIVARVLDYLDDSLNLKNLLDNKVQLAPRSRLTISLPGFHSACSYHELQRKIGYLERPVTSLDEYLEACYEIFIAYKQFGVVAFKDQSAYDRTLGYQNPTHAEAEKVFNWLAADPRRKAGYPDQLQPLDDFLFHEFMRMARELELPVQLHTGHMAGIRNDVRKANAIHLTNMLELHQDVRFDLFHGNWPYMGEYLFLGKNYPNVYLNLCWVNIIDQLYSQQLMKEAVMSVPHSKIFAFGADFSGRADAAWAHADIARENVAVALSDLVEAQYIDLDEAKAIARAWMYDNPNQYFDLGLPEIN